MEWADKHPESTARGINDLGQVVGSSIVSWTGLDPATDSPIEHAFVWTPQAGMVDLGTLIGGPAATGGTSMASAINGLGQVVGWSETALGGVHGIIVTPEDSDGDGAPDLWFRDDDLDGVNDLMVDLGTLGGADSRAFYVNDLGQVVGESTTVLGEMHGFLWAAAQGMSDLGVLGGLVEFSSSASHVSDSGQVVGQSTTDMGEIHAYQRTAEGAMEDLGTLGGLLESWSDARAVNEGGQVVGTSLSDGGQEHAFLWSTNDGMVDLGTLGLLPGSSSSASDINAVGQVVGTSTTDTSESHAFLWTPSGGMIDLGTLGGASSEATSVNDLGQVVGSSKTAAGEDRAFVWTAEDGLRDLGTLGGSTSSATSVNGVGQVAGAGTTLQGFTHAAVFAITAASNADMSVSVVSAPATAQVGGIVEYRFRVENGGPDTANGVAFSFSFPSAILRRTSIGFQAGNGFSCSGNACSGGIMQSGDFNTFTLEFAVEAAGTAVVAADVTADTEDPDVGNNSSSATTEISVPTTADIALTKQAVFDRFDPTPDELNIEEQFFYDLVVTNNGPDVAPGVTITDLLPPEVSFTTFGAVNQFLTCETTSRVGRICTNGDSVRCGHAVDGAPEGSISCSVLNTIEVGESRTARIRVEAAAVGTAVNTAASAIAALTDPTPGNNNSSATVTIVPEPGPTTDADADISVSLVSAPATAQVGGIVEYRFRVENGGPDTTSGVAFSFSFPSAILRRTSIGFQAGNGFSCSGNACSGGIMQSGDFNTFTLEFAVEAAGTAVVAADVTADARDPDVGNNSSSATTEISVPTTADIALTKQAVFDRFDPTPDELNIEEQFFYDLVVTNNGPDVAPGVTITDLLPPEVSFTTFGAVNQFLTCETTSRVGRICTNGDSVRCGHAVDGAPEGSISCSVLNTIEVGESRTARIRVEAVVPGTFANTALSAIADLTDPVAGNNGASVTTTIVPPPNSPPVADARSVTAEGRIATSITLTGSDPDGDAITFAIVSAPANGTLTGTAPNLTYTSDPGFTGTDSFTFKANDGQVDSNVATVTITVVDTTPPALTAPPDVTAEATALDTPVDIGTASATDLVDGAIMPSNDAPAAGFPLGVTVFTWSATDASGNTATATQSVTVVDTTAPVVTAPGDITAEANAVLSTLDIGQATATDIFPVSVDNDAPSAGFPLGTTTVTWTVTDTSGNKATATQSVTIVDTTPPVLNLPANVTAEANAALSTVDIGQATAADIFPVTITNDAPAGFPLGTTVVTWTATDTSGNAASATQNVTVVDTTPPVLTVPPDVTVTASGALTQVDIGTATASDIFPVTIDNDAPAAGFPIGVTEVTWTATDANGNSASAVQTVRAEFAFGGFLTPLRPSGIYKLGRTLPLKFQLFFADGSPALTATAMLQLQQLAAGEPVGDPIEAESTSAADSGNIFRLADSKYLFNLATKPLSKGSFRVLVTLNDGSSPKAIDIGFK